MTHILTTLLLQITGGGWAAQYFTAVRQSSIAHAGVISSIATTLACVFISFKFIKMYYDLVSDEQSGGFGGVRMWDILRPLVILILVMTFGTWLSWLDTVCNSVSASLVSNINFSNDKINDDIAAKLDELDDEINKSKEDMYNEAVQLAANTSGVSSDEEYNKLLSEMDQIVKDDALKTLPEGSKVVSYDSQKVVYKEKATGLWDRLINFKTKKNVKETSLETLQAAEDPETDLANYIEERQTQLNTYKTVRDDEYKRQKEVKKWAKWLNIGPSIIGTIFEWLFNIFFVVMMAFADLMLCLLAMFGPIAAAMSILEPWKQSLSSWIGHYIEVSLWKPIGSAICWVVLSVKTTVGMVGLNTALNTSASAGKASILGSIGASCLILFAGYMAVLNVPSITNTILSLGSMSDQFTNSAANATGTAMHAPVGGVKAIGGLRSSAAGRAASKAQAGQLSQIAQGVKKMAGGGGA